MQLILISAMTRDRVIGSNEALPWNIPEEYEKFLSHVRGNVVLMGRTSYRIFGGDLSDSELIVVSRSVRELPDAKVCPSIETALATARAHGKTVFSAGGASIYAQTLPLADAIYLSLVKKSYSGDTYFPEFDETEWIVRRTEDHPDFEFRAYQRKTAS